MSGEGRPVPARITQALDLRGLDGPEVDIACGTWEGNPAGDVDMWELAAAVPSAKQLALLAELTGFPVAWFYRPVEPGPLPRVIVCHRARRRGCESPEPGWIDERGVLHYGGQPPRTLPGNTQGALF